MGHTIYTIRTHSVNKLLENRQRKQEHF